MVIQCTVVLLDDYHQVETAAPYRSIYPRALILIQLERKTNKKILVYNFKNGHSVRTDRLH